MARAQARIGESLGPSIWTIRWKRSRRWCVRRARSGPGRGQVKPGRLVCRCSDLALRAPRALRRDGEHDVADLLCGLDVAVGVDDLVQRVPPVDDRRELPGLD